MMEESLLTIKQTAERLQLSSYTVRRQLRTGRLRGIKRGGVWRVPVSALYEPAPGLPDLDELLQETGAAMRQSGITTPSDIKRIIREVRQELRNG